MVTALAMVRSTGTELRVLNLLACACDPSPPWLLIVVVVSVLRLMALFRACCLTVRVKGAGTALCSCLLVQVWMTVAPAEGTSLLNFSGQVNAAAAFAAAAFAAAFDFASLRSLLTIPAAFALAFDAKIVRWHAATASAAPDSRFFLHDLLDEPPAAFCCQVKEIVQRAAAAIAAAIDIVRCLSASVIHVFELVLRWYWDLVGASGLRGIFCSLSLSVGKWEKPSFIQGLTEDQAWIWETSSVALVEHDMTKGFDKHDTDGACSWARRRISGLRSLSP